MIIRIKELQPLDDYILRVVFDDGRTVLYDVKEDFGLPGYSALQTEKGLFPSVRLDPSRTCVYWSDDVDLPSDILY